MAKNRRHFDVYLWFESEDDCPLPETLIFTGHAYSLHLPAGGAFCPCAFAPDVPDEQALELLRAFVARPAVAGEIERRTVHVHLDTLYPGHDITEWRPGHSLLVVTADRCFVDNALARSALPHDSI